MCPCSLFNPLLLWQGGTHGHIKHVLDLNECVCVCGNIDLQDSLQCVKNCIFPSHTLCVPAVSRDNSNGWAMKLSSVSHNSTKVQKTVLSFLFQGWVLAPSLQIFIFLWACLHSSCWETSVQCLSHQVVNVASEREEHCVAKINCGEEEAAVWLQVILELVYWVKCSDFAAISNHVLSFHF